MARIILCSSSDANSCANSCLNSDANSCANSCLNSCSNQTAIETDRRIECQKFLCYRINVLSVVGVRCMTLGGVGCEGCRVTPVCGGEGSGECGDVQWCGQCGVQCVLCSGVVWCVVVLLCGVWCVWRRGVVVIFYVCVVCVWSRDVWNCDVCGVQAAVQCVVSQRSMVNTQTNFAFVSVHLFEIFNTVSYARLFKIYTFMHI